MLKLYLFGSPQVILDEQALKIVRRKSRALLYYLAAQERPANREKLLEIFWPDLPRAEAQQTLRTNLYALRKALGEWLVADGEWVSLVDQAWVDARVLAKTVSGRVSPLSPGALQGKAPELAAAQALELYRGEFLAGFSLPDVQGFEDWLTIEREHYRRSVVRGLSELARVYEAGQDYGAALNFLDRALAIDPLQEDLQRDGIRLQHLAGDRPGAIRRYDALRRLLDEEMGVPPMAETRALYDAIITDHPLPAGPKARSRPTLSQAAAAPAARPAPRPPDEIPFSGRAAELVAMQQLAGAQKLVLLVGEPGIGKTRLAEEYITLSGRLSLTGQARELEQALPYQPFIQALRCLLARPEWQALQTRLLQELAPLWLGEAARLLPELASALPQGLPAAERPGDEAQAARLWEGLRQFLLAVSRLVEERQRPLILLIDDLQWADSSSLALLSYLLRQPGPPALTFLAASRPFVPGTALASFLQGLRREGRLELLELPRLEAQDVRRLAARFSAAYAEPLTNWLWEHSEGNPYILVELLRSLRRTGLLLPDGVVNLTGLSAAPLVPQTVYSLIQSRLAPLSEAARRVLDAGVAAGRRFDFEVVARASGLSENAALDGLDELQAAGLVSSEDGLHFQFDHSLTMEVAYRETGELRHRLLHRRVAEALHSMEPEAAAKTAGLVAWHYIEGGAPEQAAPFALEAGRQAARLAAWDEASAFFEQALKGLRGQARLPALMALAETYSKPGKIARAAEVLRQALALAQSAERPALPPEEINLALARALLPQARYAEVTEIARQLGGAGRPHSAAAELLWGTALAMEGADLDSAGEHLAAAEKLWHSQNSSDFATLGQIKFEQGNVAAQRGRLDEAVACYREALAIATQHPSRSSLEQRILAYNNLAYHLHLLGDASAEQEAQTGLALAQEKGILGFQAYLYSTLGEIALGQGNLEQAERHFQTGLHFAEQFGLPERVAGLNANLGLLAARRGETSLALHRLSAALGQADALGVHHLAAQIRLWLAPLLPRPQALARLAEARAIAESSGRKLLLEDVSRLQEELGGS